MTIAEMQLDAWATAEAKGFHDTRGAVIMARERALILLALVHTEVSEVAQELKRHGTARPLKIAEELADVLIRVGDLAQCLGLDVEDATQRKLAENARRPHLYGTPWEGGGTC